MKDRETVNPKGHDKSDGDLTAQKYSSSEWIIFLRDNASSPKVGRPQGLRCSRSFRPIAGLIYQPGATRMTSNKKALDNR